MERKRTYRLPQGAYTENEDEHIREWQVPGLIVAEAMGYHLHGYDPGYSFLPKDPLNHGWCEMTADAVLNLAAFIRSHQ